MPIKHVSLLKIQRELHEIPRSMKRFSSYLKMLLNDKGDDLRYAPLVAMNPMGREHVAERLDEILQLDADSIAEELIQELIQQLPIHGDYQHGLVILDDIGGGWTNRTTVDASFRFAFGLPLKRPWLTTGLWVSEAASSQLIMESVRATVYQIAYLEQRGSPKTLAEIMTQIGMVDAFAGRKPQYDTEELAYTRSVLAPYLDSADYSIHIAALYGDEAAKSLGYKPMGLSKNAGIDLARANILKKDFDPLAWLKST